MVIDQLGGSPQIVFSIPLTVRGKVVAVLYADSASSDSEASNLDALEILVRVAAMAVNLVSGHRAAPEPRPEATAVRTEPATERVAEVESPYSPQVEAQVAEPESQPAPVETAKVSTPVEVTPEEIPATEAIAEEPPAQLAAEPAAAVEPSAPQAPPEPETIPKPADSVWSESVLQSSTPPPAFVSDYTTPLGSARRFGVSEPDLPIEVSEEERRLHNDARRFARLLVSEIKLYNEPKVKEGRSHGDLYDRLREDIDRSRQMYDKRVAPPVAARHDYFHQELVNMLAEGDPAKLGGSYPGAVSA
jgi:outer membrane biosynthesis protein TonB